MVELIKKYQKEYLELIEGFISKENRSVEEYLSLVDKVELLYKRNKKTIFNMLELNKNAVYFGGATYFSKGNNEIYPIIIANKKVIVAEPILKLSLFLKHSESFNSKRVIEIIDRAIEQTLELKFELINAIIIYINPNDFLKDLKEGISQTAGELTLQYFNNNLNLKYQTLNELIKDNLHLDFEKLSKKYDKLNELIMTVVSKPSDTLKEKIMKNLMSTGVNKEELAKQPPIYNIVLTLIGLFGQAFELKSISLILHIPLYINRPNVLLYVNFINYVDEDEKSRVYESNILFALYMVLKKYDFTEDYNKIIYLYGDGKVYNEVVGECNKDKIEIGEYIKIIEEKIIDNKHFKKIIKKCSSKPHLSHKENKTIKINIKH